MLLEKKKKRISNEKWKELVEEYKKSNVSKYEFCKQKNVPRSTFYKWHRILVGSVASVIWCKIFKLFIDFSIKQLVKEIYQSQNYNCHCQQVVLF